MKTIVITFFSFILYLNLSAQNNKSIAHQFFASKDYISFLKNAEKNHTIAADANDLNTKSASGIFQVHSLIEKSRKLSESNLLLNTSKTNDTLIVTDTLEITGTYLHSGPIIVFGGGLLRFKNANATILGDIYVWGANSRLYADSSYLYIPQQYFYQRSLLVIDGGIVKYSNTTLDHSGLSHNLVAGSNAYIEMNNVENIGFTTNGVYDNAEFHINGINEAGEYVTTDYSKLFFKNANTILLWHQFPDTAQINFSFPDGDTLLSYHFINNIPGVNGIAYEVQMDSCTNVMWGLMPDRGSDVSISNSKIRSIGLWFSGSDTITVSGLVDNSHYASFTASLSDRMLQLNNCDVQTWSLYPMENSHIELSGCIVGEVGTMNSSSFTGTSFTCDGSGGYMWATDTTFLVAGFCSAVNSVRSQGMGMLLFGYSSLMGGYPAAIGNSVLMVVQSNVLQEPVPLDKSCIWFALIEKPFETYTDTITKITGSAWIDKTATSTWMDFGSKHMYYQKAGAAAWTEIPCDTSAEVHDDTLCMWNTHGLQPGQYNLKLLLRDNWGNPVEAIKSINVLPKILGIGAIEEESIFSVYPNPATDKVNIYFNNSSNQNIHAKIIDVTGKVLIDKFAVNTDGSLKFDISNLDSGIYFLKIIVGEKDIYSKFIKY